VIIDANILISGILKDAATRKLIFNEHIKLYAPRYLVTEIFKYEDILIKKSKLTKEAFKELLIELLSYIEIIDHHKLSRFIDKALSITPDRKDILYVAACLLIHKPLWTNDKRLHRITEIQTITTEELLLRLKKKL